MLPHVQATPYRVVPVDPDDDAALQTYHDTFSRGSEADRTDPTTWTLEEVRVHLRGPGTALFAYVRERAEANDRTSVYAELNVRPGAEQSAPGAAFLTKHGL